MRKYLTYLLVLQSALLNAQSIWEVPTGDWNTATNWQPDGVPNAVDVIINNNGTATINATPPNINRLDLGLIAPGFASNGNLTIQNGASLTDTGSFIGSSPLLSGQLLVTDNSTYTSGSIIVGNEGTGILIAENGSQINDSTISLGQVAGSNGTVQVRDPGTQINSTGFIAVGTNGNGVLTIENGGSVSSNSEIIGVFNGSTGIATVTGPGSTWASTGIRIRVGREGNGTLNIQDGGVLTCNLFQSGEPGATGIILVEDLGSQIIVANNAEIGRSGISLLTIANAGLVSVTGNTTLAITGGNGTLNLNGTAGSRGILNTASLIGGSGSPLVNFNGGILQANTTDPSFITGFGLNQLNIEAGGAFIDSNGFNIGTNNGFSGVGALTKIGAGSLVLGGNNTNAGLNVDAGNLLATALVTGPVNVNNTATAIFSGTIQGSLNANGNSATINDGIVNGAVTTNGSAFFQSNGVINGAVTANDNSNALLNNNVNGSLTVNNNADIFVGVPATVAGSATVNSGGLFVFGTLTGPATVNGGVMAVTGTVIGLVQTNQDGLLIGTGSVGELVNGGRVSPGTLGGIGTLTVTGNHINTSSGTHINDLNAAGQTDLLVVNGTSTLEGGTLDIVAAPGNYLSGTTYTLITAAGGLTGEFATVIDNLPINYFLRYLPNSLVLQLGDAVSPNGLNCGARRVAEYFNTFGSFNGDSLAILEALESLGFDVLDHALDQLHPAPFQALSITAGDAAHAVNDSFMDRLNFLRLTRCGQCCDPCDQGGIWISGIANYVSFDRVDCLRGFDATNGGIALGYDQCFCDDIIAGIGAGYSNNYIHWNRHYGHSDGNNYYLGIYATQFDEDYYADVSLLGFTGHYKSKRHIEFADIDRRAKSKQCNWGINPHLGSGLILDYCGIDVIPFGEIDYYYLSQDKFHEHGADTLNLRVKDHHASLLRLETGVRFAKAYDCCGYGQFLPYASISYVGHRYYGRKFKSSFNDQPNDFSVFGTDRCFNQAEFGLGFAYLINDQFAINASYDIDVGSKRQQQEFNFELNYRF